MSGETGPKVSGHRPTDETRRYVLTMAGVRTRAAIARQIGISPATLDRHYRAELDGRYDPGGERRAAPFGWRRIAGVLVPAPKEQAAIERIHQLRADGLGFATIARRIKDGGVAISTMSVWRVLRRQQ
jgi:hypothetical protein